MAHTSRLLSYAQIPDTISRSSGGQFGRLDRNRGGTRRQELLQALVFFAVLGLQSYIYVLDTHALFSPLATTLFLSFSIPRRAPSELISLIDCDASSDQPFLFHETRVWDPEGREYIDMLSAYS
jgi:hypothetical protein